MDSIDLGKALFGKQADTVKVNTSSNYTSPTNTTTISGVAVANSDNGMVTCLVAGTTCDVPTTVSVKDGDTVIISNTAHNPVVTGVIAGGDRAQAEVDDAAARAEAAHAAAEEAAQAAGEASTAAGEATTAAGLAATAASEATTMAQAATNGLVEANQQIADTRADVEAVQADIASQKEELDTVSNTMDATLASIGDLSSLDTTLVSKVEQSAAQISSTVSEVSNLQTELGTAQSDITAAQSKADEAATAAANAAKAAATAQTKADDATKAAADAQTAAIDAAEQYTNDIAETLQGQIDGAIETWSGTVAPTASNAPAKDWKTADDRKKHIGDLYYDTMTGYAYRYGTDYTWALIKDTDVTKAIADAAAAQQAADNAQTTANTAKTDAATAQTAATNAANAASTAQAGVDDLKPRVSSAESSITQLSNSITAEVAAREGTDAQVSTLTQTASGLRFDLDATTEGVETLNSYLEYADGTLTLGKEGDPSKVQIDNDSVDIVFNGNTSASFGDTVTIGTRREGYEEGKNSTTIGYKAVANGGNSIAVGLESWATGENSAAIGHVAIANGTGSISLGVGTKASGLGAISLGTETAAVGKYSTSFGLDTISNGESQYTAGRWNVPDTVSAEIIGNGTSDTARSNARTLDWDGNEWLAGALDVGDKVGTVKNLKPALVNVFYPVGAVYISYVSTSPASLFGGTWTAITGRFPYFNAGTSTGGSNTHTLTVSEMPSHSHNAHLQRGSSPWGLANNSAYAGNVAIADNNNGSYSVNTASVGSGQSHNNMPAYQTFYAWRRTA